jgi:hypothetical protein
MHNKIELFIFFIHSLIFVLLALSKKKIVLLAVATAFMLKCKLNFMKIIDI